MVELEDPGSGVKSGTQVTASGRGISHVHDASVPEEPTAEVRPVAGDHSMAPMVKKGNYIYTRVEFSIHDTLIT